MTHAQIILKYAGVSSMRIHTTQHEYGLPVRKATAADIRKRESSYTAQSGDLGQG